MPAPRLILASRSPRRLELLAQAGVTVAAVAPSAIDETPQPNELPLALVKRLAASKARAVGSLYPDAYILAADTTCALGRRIIGTPADSKEAQAILQKFSGRRHRVMTAVALLTPTGKLHQRHDSVTVKFKPLTAAEVAWYLATKEWQGCAGAYQSQKGAARFIEYLRGAPSTVTGLPMHVVARLLQPYGLAV